jgi:predicted nuclease of predicted toxin-antitoxin system
MKLLLDQGLPRSTVRHLARRGMAAEHVGELGLARAEDAAILAEAQRRGATVATLDADFHALLANSGARSPSVIRIRIQGLNAEQLAELLAEVESAAGGEIDAGAVVSVTPSRIRVRLLPIG